MESRDEPTRADELERVYWETLRELEALLHPPADEDAPPLAA